MTLKYLYFIISFALYLAALTLNIFAVLGNEVFAYSFQYQDLIVFFSFASMVPVGNLARTQVQSHLEIANHSINYPLHNIWTNLVGGKEAWIFIVMVCSTAYFLINLTFYVYYQPSTTAFENGKYILTDHTRFVCYLTLKEFHQYRIRELKFFSSLAMASFCFDSYILYPAKIKDSAERH